MNFVKTISEFYQKKYEIRENLSVMITKPDSEIGRSIKHIQAELKNSVYFSAEAK